MSNVDGKVYKTRFKKTLSVLSQAGLTSKTLYNFDYGSASVDCSCGTVAACLARDPKQVSEFCALFNGTLKGHTSYGLLWNMHYTIDRREILTGWDNRRMTLQLSDGTLIVYAAKNRSDAMCTLPAGELVTKDWIDSHPQCLGFIDVNGTERPNQEVKCSDEDTTTDVEHPCEVKLGNDMSDIYPVVFHDSDVTPASNAAMAVWLD